MENPNTVHGRMLEAAHIAGYTFRRARDELTWLLEDDRWKELGFKDGSEFTRSIKATFSEFHISKDDRSALARQLQNISSQRAIADMVGVDERTTRRDLHTAANAAPAPSKAAETDEQERTSAANAAPTPPTVAETDEQERTSGPNGPPDEWFSDETIDPAKLATKRARRKQRDHEAEERRAEQLRDSISTKVGAPTARIEHGDFRTVLNALKGVNAVITDPPYGKEHLPLLADLAEWADKVLTHDGVLAVLFGQTHLAEAYQLLQQGRRPYRWTMAYLTPGPGYVSHARKVQSQWKPVLIYGGGERFVDVVNAATISSGIEKTHHEWEQDVTGFQELIRRMTKPGDLIADPFAGAGTTLLAALMCDRNAVGAEIDRQHFRTIQKRLSNDN